MLITMKQELFDSLDENSLPWACIEPVIQQIRGRNFNIKSQVYTQLTAGQRALLMFQVIYGHTRNGIGEFFNHTSYFLGEQGVWGQFKSGMKYFGEKAMLELIEDIEEVYQLIQDENNKESQVDLGDNRKLKDLIDQIDRQLKELMPMTLKSIGAYIRKHPNEFVQINE